MSKAKKNKSQDKQKYNKEIIGIISIAISLLSIVSLHTNSTGLTGRIIKVLLLSTFGIGGYILPYMIIVSVVMYLLNKLNIKKVISVTLLNIVFITMIHAIKLSKNNLTFIESVKISIPLGVEGIGGGLVGCIFSNIIVSLFGKTGLYIVSISVIIICLLILTNKSLVEVTRTSYEQFKIFMNKTIISLSEFFKFDKSQNKKVKVKKDEKVKSDIIAEKNDGQKENIESKIVEKDEDDKGQIKVLDYTTNKVEDLTINTNRNSLDYTFPSIDILSDKEEVKNDNSKEEVLKDAEKIIETLRDFGIEAKVSQVTTGPSIIRYEIQPAPGIRVNKIVGLSNDIALSLGSSNLRIEAPIPGKSAIGIEVPNKNKVGVQLREIIETEKFENIRTNIPMAVGRDISGMPIVTDIEKMPHLLVAGATGSGKSVCINTLIASIIYKSSPKEVRLLMIDPKIVELSIYNGIPHLLIPVVTDPKKASNALNWAVQEMDKRYKLLADTGSRDITGYNKKIDTSVVEKMSSIVIIIDELADLMMTSASEVENSICRLAQKARAAGIHLIVATQRPSVDVITGTIKANIPSRIAFSVSSQVDSKTILGTGGAEKLLGRGDMLFHPTGQSAPIRVQGAFISDTEVEEIVNFLKDDGSVKYEEDIIEEIQSVKEDVELDDSDELLPQSIEIVIDEGQASISLLQRKLKIGYARAARIVDQMEQRGIVGGHEGSKPRKILVTKEELEG